MKKKVIVSALALAIGAGLAGSVTSTIAWYQYSTRTTAAYVGVAGGTSGNLQLRFKEDGQADDAGWTTKILKEDMATYLAGKSRASNVVPVTSGQLLKKDIFPAKLYQNPIYGVEAQTSWKEATAANYVKIELELRYVEKQGTNENNVAKNIYLSDLFLEQDESDKTLHEDISSAIRFHIAAYSDPAAKQIRLISKNGGTTLTHGYLDLNNDGQDDVKYDKKSDKYGFTNGEGTKISYGGTESTQTTYSASDMVADLANDVKDGDRLLGVTVASSSSFLSVDINIWVEGWAKFPAGNSGKAIWDVEDFSNAKFDVGFEFEAELEQSKTNNIDY